MTLTVTLSGAGPLVLEDGFALFRCGIPVLPGGDGAESAPLVKRTAKCGHLSNVVVGSAPTCEHHLRVCARLACVSYPKMLGAIVPLDCEPAA
jgi:hypothetical protein